MEGTAVFVELPPLSPAFVGGAAEGQANAEAVTRAELLVEQSRYEEAVAALGEVLVPAASSPGVALRVLHTEAWARMYLGELELAAALCERARALAEGPAYSDVDRAESLFRLGAVRVKLNRPGNAVSLLGEAIRLATGHGLSGDVVAARAYEWRARCHVVHRDWDAAQADAERAAELAEGLGDLRLVARARMQCSIVAERRGDPRLARYYAEAGREAAAAGGDRQTEARLLNNLGGLSFLLGEAEVAVAQITDSYRIFLEIGADTDAAQAISSLAQVHLRCGAPQLAEEQARHALSILGERDDYVDERGNAHLVVGRALFAQGRRDEAMTELAAAEWLFERLGSRSHVAAAWMAQADVYEALGDTQASSTLYRRAAEALQDFNF